MVYPSNMGIQGSKGSMEKQHPTFVNHLVALLEDIDRWENDEEVTKKDMAMGSRTKILMAMRAGMVHPFTTFYSLDASTVTNNVGKK
jgi:hypothetical protein